MGRMNELWMQVVDNEAEAVYTIECLWEDVLAKCALTESRTGEQAQLLVEHVRSLQEIVLRLAGEVRGDFNYPKFENVEALGMDGHLATQIAEAVRLSLDSCALYEHLNPICPDPQEDNFVDEPEPWVPDRVEELD